MKDQSYQLIRLNTLQANLESQKQLEVSEKIYYQLFKEKVFMDSVDSLADYVSLFPYVDLWRIRGRPNLNTKFSIVVSILLILIVGSIAISKLIQVSRMTTIFSTQDSQMNMQVPFTNMTTSYSDESSKQFMFAMFIDQTVASEPKLQRSEYNVYGSHVERYFNQFTGAYDTKKVVFQLQSCTKNHFLNTLDLQQSNLHEWLCLPINNNYEIGGNTLSNHKYVQLNISCLTSNCRNQTNNGVLVRLYVLNTFVNANNGSQPFKSFVYRYQSTLKPLSFSNKYFYFNKNYLITDNSLLPFESLDTKSSMSIGDVVSNQINFSLGCGVSVIILHSGTNMKFKRTYLKILDALSYLGGIFNALLGAFFFMNAFGKLFFEIEFASLLFNKQQLRKNGMWTVIKHMFYKGLVYIGRQPEWQYEKNLQKFKTTVNNLLDIVYLQRRLRFLQKAVQIMFDSHQIKGLYLSYNTTREDQDRKYKDYHFRGNFLEFFKKRQEEGKSSFMNTENVKRRKKSFEINLYPYKSRQSQSQRSNYVPESNLRLKTQHCLQNELKVPKERWIQRHATKTNNDPLKNQNLADIKKDEQNQLKHDDSSLLSQENLKSLLKLYREARVSNQDQISKRIYQKMDIEIRQRIEELARNYQLSL